MDKDLLSTWFIFGEHPDGYVDISDGNGDVLTHVRRNEAEKLIDDREQLVRKIIELEEQLQNLTTKHE